MIKSTIKALITNLLIIFLFIFIFELIFGYWFDKDNLGPYMREHRMKSQKIEYEFNGIKEEFVYRRNYYGFRGEDMEPSEINAVIIGGSDIDQRYEPEKYTIAGYLNENLNKDLLNLKIINAGIEALSTRGMVVIFNNWFLKLKDFSPKIILLYVGMADQKIIDVKKDNNLFDKGSLLIKTGKIDQLKDNIKSRSIILDSIRIFKFKFLPKKDFVKYDGNIDSNLKKNFKYLTYNQAIEKFDLSKLKQEYDITISDYLNRIDVLYQLSKKLNSTPIFITNISSGGFTKRALILNTALIEHCKISKYYCIDMAKNLNSDFSYWKDGMHTTSIGSKAIADLIYKDLKKILARLN